LRNESQELLASVDGPRGRGVVPANDVTMRTVQIRVSASDISNGSGTLKDMLEFSVSGTKWVEERVLHVPQTRTQREM
jgi:hypothetical protein